jgi:ribosomal-protein-alanine N-acetyltransferase
MNVAQPILRTERLILRPFRNHDLADIFAYASDREVAKYVLWSEHKTLADSQFFLDFIQKSTCAEAGKLFFGFAIEWNGKVIGSIDFKNVHAQAGQIDYALGKEYWGQGIMTEAAACLRDWSFNTFSNFVRLQAYCMVENIGSRRVMEKTGMQLEGVRLKSMIVKGAPVDIAHYALVR